jgi:hypothetical protein
MLFFHSLLLPAALWGGAGVVHVVDERQAGGEFFGAIRMSVVCGARSAWRRSGRAGVSTSSGRSRASTIAARASRRFANRPQCS